MGRIKNQKKYISDEDYSSILKRIYDIADELEISLWLTFGTLLGYAQQRKRFKWDNDIDLATTTSGFCKLQQNQHLLEKAGFYIRNKKPLPNCYREMFIYDKKIQPFHIDISEFILDKSGRYTYRWMIRVNIASKCFDYLYKTFLKAVRFTNKNKEIPFFDSEKYEKYKKKKITNYISNILFKIDLFFTTTRELGMKINALKLVKYYGAYVKIPHPYGKYCEVNYGKVWKTPIEKRKTFGGSTCLKEKIDGIERCYLD